MLQITALYAGLLGLMFLGLSVVVIRRRQSEGVNLGTGGKISLERAVRAHGNFAEYIPLALVLMGIIELNNFPSWQLHLLGILLLVGRILHGYCFVFTESSSFARIGGIAITFTALSLSALGCLWIGF